MADLSPAARAVLDACDRAIDREMTSLAFDPFREPLTRDIAAAALRAVADQAVPEAANAVGDEHDEARRDQWLRIRWKILAIAAELEGADG